MKFIVASRRIDSKRDGVPGSLFLPRALAVAKIAKNARPSTMAQHRGVGYKARQKPRSEMMLKVGE
jgi:hypothetical protein